LKELRNRVLRELLLAPSVVVPIVAGCSAWLLSWAADGVASLNLAGLIGVLGGVGWMATRYLFQTEKIAQQAFDQLQRKAEQEEESELDRLEQLLSQDDDHRDQELLRLLRIYRAQFQEIARQPTVAIRSQEVLMRVNQLFKASVNNLYESYRLWLQSRKLGPAERDTFLADRERLLDEIRQAVDSLQSSLSQYQRVTKRSAGTQLTRLREELETSIEIAKRTEDRLRQMDASPDHPAYLPELE
jgi:hypothetical protein